MIEGLNDLFEIPFIKRLLQFPLVDRFKIFLGAYTLGIMNKWTKRLQKFMSLKTLILINLAVLAYYAGKANAVSFSEWYHVFIAFHLWFKSAILINAFYLIARLLRLIFILVLIVIAFVFIIWILCEIISLIFYTNPSDTENKMVVGKSDNPK